jgi:hypothetical protein
MNYLEQAYQHGQALNSQLQQQVSALSQNQAHASGSNANSGSSSSGPRPKAPPMNLFNGLMGSSGFAVDHWIREVNKQFTHYGPSTFQNDEAKIKFAVTWFSGAALDWWESEERDYQANNNNASLFQAGWDHFVECLRDRYRPQLPAEIARQRLRGLVQKGRVETYCNAFLSLVAHIPDRAEEDKIFDFKTGLVGQLAAKVAEKQPKTLQEAMEIAVQAEPYIGNRSGSSNNNNYRGAATAPRSNGGHSNANYSNSGSVPMDINAIAAGSQGNSSPEDSDGSNGGATHPGPADPMQLLLAKIHEIEHRVLAMNQSRGASKFGNKSKGNRDHIPGLTAADIVRLQKENRCFFCKQEGHMKSECPHRLK